MFLEEFTPKYHWGTSGRGNAKEGVGQGKYYPLIQIFSTLSNQICFNSKRQCFKNTSGGLFCLPDYKVMIVNLENATSMKMQRGRKTSPSSYQLEQNFLKGLFHSCNRYLQSTHLAQGGVPGAGDRLVNEAESPPSIGLMLSKIDDK